MQSQLKLIITIKSGNPEQLHNAYTFIANSLDNCELILEMIFIHQDAVQLLSNQAIYSVWKKLLAAHNITAKICKSALSKRNVGPINWPFVAGSLVEFIAATDQADQVVQF